MTDVTRILLQIEQGNPVAAGQLLPVVYEAYLRLVDVAETQQWDSRGHFFPAAAEAMRRILVERARQRQSVKRGGGRQRVDLEKVVPEIAAPDDELLALNEALEKLQSMDKRKAELVKLRFFAGLTGAQAAQVLGISTTTADSYWAYARCWLRLEMSGDGQS